MRLVGQVGLTGIYVPDEVYDAVMKCLTVRAERKQRMPQDTDPRVGSAFFEQFWAAYPRKIGKGAAWKAWQRAKRPETHVLIDAIVAQSGTEQWRKDGGQYIPHPATWLNQRRWEDEVAPRRNVHEEGE